MLLPRAKYLVSNSETKSNGKSNQMSSWTNRAVTGARARQCTAPNVLGMISDRKRISSVSTAIEMPTYSSP